MHRAVLARAQRAQQTVAVGHRASLPSRSLSASTVSSSNSSSNPRSAHPHLSASRMSIDEIHQRCLQRRRAQQQAADSAAGDRQVPSPADFPQHLPRAVSPPAAVGAPSTPRGRSAVLIGLFHHPQTNDIHVLLTQRSAELRSHAGDVALPGGKRDESDVNDVDCALREALEEVGLPRSPDDHEFPPVDEMTTTSTVAMQTTSRLITQLKSAVSKNNLAVIPIVAEIPVPSFLLPSSSHSSFTSRLGAFTPRLNSSEVAVLFSLPLTRFLVAGDGYSFRDIDFRGHRLRMHEFRHTLSSDEYLLSDSEKARLASEAAEGGSPVPQTRTFRVWGLSAYMLVSAAMELFQTKPEFPTLASRVTTPIAGTVNAAPAPSKL